MFYLFREIGFDISCKEIICMKCQSWFSLKNKKNIVRLSSTEFAQRVMVKRRCSVIIQCKGFKLSYFCDTSLGIYSWLPLSRNRLSRITAYLKVKIWSLPNHENLTTCKTYCGKEEKLLLRSNFSSFPQYFQKISNFKSPFTHIFVKCG